MNIIQVEQAGPWKGSRKELSTAEILTSTLPPVLPWDPRASQLRSSHSTRTLPPLSAAPPRLCSPAGSFQSEAGFFVDAHDSSHELKSWNQNQNFVTDLVEKL